MKQKRKGFTLVELIVVIAIVGILAAVLIPTFSGAIESARKADDRLTVSNMNKTLTAYLAYHQIDAKDLDASEVQYIVSTEEEQYTFQPAFEGGVFWYNSNAGRIEYAETMGNPEGTIGGTTMALADGPSDGPTSIEDVYGNGYLYLNAGGELATFLLNLRNLGSVQDYANLASAVYEDGTETPKQIEGVDVSAVYEEFDPAQTLYINSTGGFIDTASYTSNTYSNKPVYEGGAWTAGGAAVTVVDQSGEEVSDITSSNATVYLSSSLPNQSLLTSTYKSSEWEGDYWVVQYNNNGTLGAYSFVTAQKENIAPAQNTIKNVVYATGLRVVPSLNIGVNIAMEEDITLPATVYTVMQNAFTEVVSETRLVAKSQYAEVVEGALSSTMTTSIAEKTVEQLMNNVQSGNDLLKVYLFEHSLVYHPGFIGIGRSYDSLAVAKGLIKTTETADSYNILKNAGGAPIGYLFENTSPEGFIGKIDTTEYEVGNEEGAYRLYLDTSELVKAFPTIHTIDVKYAPRTLGDSEVYDITVQAFDNSGMCLNLVVTYKQPATEEAA